MGDPEKISMRPLVHRPDPNSEFDTPERCGILEAWGDPSDAAVSIARARVAVGVTTQWHRLRGVDERYLIVEGIGSMEVGGLAPETVTPGDIVVIPAGTRQRIRNVGQGELVFYCVCSPRFVPECYEALDEAASLDLEPIAGPGA
jgi:mannose-6-phosphate isomerase-like protein (cupin superfamily)